MLSVVCPDVLASWFDTVLHWIREPQQPLAEAIERAGSVWIPLGILCLILFCETGLVVAPFLPGDSLLFVCGSLAAQVPMQQVGFELWPLIPLLMLAVILGDSTNYWIGRFIGPKIFHKEHVRFLDKENLHRAHRFYSKHGGKTVFIARFLPILRTFAPFVAGIGSMNYPRFLMFSVTGTIAWISTFVLAGYFFGANEFVKKNFFIVVIAIIIISLMPAFMAWLSARRAARRTAKAAEASPQNGNN
jgi:membrane-associated protein